MKTLFTPLVWLFMLVGFNELQANDLWSLYCPNDTTVSCDAELWDLSTFGNAYYHDAYGYHSAGTPTVSKHMNGCGGGYIRRTWTIEDPYWNIQKCTQTIYIGSPGGVFKESNIHWPKKEITLVGCNPNTDPSVTGEPTYDIVGCSMIAVGHTDKLYTVNESCKKLMRTWKVMDWCQANVGGAWAKDGIWEYIQTIIILNNDIPAVVCPKDTLVMTMDCHYADVVLPDLKVDSSSCGGKYTITNNSPYSTSKGANASGRYPVGVTKVSYIIQYGCGSKKYCEFYITVRGGKAPTPICISELAIGLMGMDSNKDGINDLGMVSIWAKDLNLKSEPNCGYGQLTFSFSPDSLVMSKTFTCDDLGINQVKMYVKDQGGNQSYCQVRVDVQNNGAKIENCVRKTTEPGAGEVNSSTKYSFFGKAKDVNGNSLENIELSLYNKDSLYVESTKTIPVITMVKDSFVNASGAMVYFFEPDTTYETVTDTTVNTASILKKKSLSNGKFSFDKCLLGGQDYVLEVKTPEKNGTINTYDLKLIADFAFGNVLPKNELVKLAADIDGSGVIDAQDLQLMLDYFAGKNPEGIGSARFVLNAEGRSAMGESFIFESVSKSISNVELVLINLGDVSNTAGDIPGFNINQPNFGAQKANIGIQQLSMYPNPFAGQLFLQVTVANNQNTTLRLFDQLGKLARTMPINLNQGEQTVSMDFSDLHSGVYIYQINVDDQIHSGKLIKQD